MLEAAAEPELDPEDLVHFSVGDLPSRGYGVMGEIRRQGKLCDVTLKVRPGPGGRNGGTRGLRDPRGLGWGQGGAAVSGGGRTRREQRVHFGG